MIVAGVACIAVSFISKGRLFRACKYRDVIEDFRVAQDEKLTFLNFVLLQQFMEFQITDRDI